VLADFSRSIGGCEMKKVNCFIHTHSGNEHVVMASVYGSSAATVHHWVGSILVALGYFYVAVVNRSAHKCHIPE
jgi:hypothetical protein